MQINRRVPIIKAVGDWCNLRCIYCFYNGMNQKPIKVLKKDLLESFFEQYFKLFSGEMRFVWHGGEPLLAGINFYEEALVMQRKFMKSGDVVENLIQTNATLITNQWAKFFKENKFRVGVSIDGTRERHNSQRPTASNHGSFDEVMRGIEILRNNGITPGIIQTVLRSGVETLVDDFHFFADEQGLRGWALNFFMDGSSQSSKLSKEGLQEQDVTKIYSILIREWLKRNDPNLCVREIENIIAGVVGRRAKSCSFNGMCANYFCLDADGLVWPCDRLSSDAQYLLGNLKQVSLAEILNGPASLHHAACAAKVAEDCKSCKWKAACNNGCTAMRNPDTGKYVYCNARQEIFNAVENLLSSTNHDSALLEAPAER